ncbi:MAG: penicillin-binding protein [Ruminiclostridium sp.]|nr:penicillin-binding protein [Ruminiclostridium sp.]
MSNEKNGKKIRNVKIREEEPHARPKRMKAEEKISLLHKPTPLERIGAVLSAAGTAILCMILILIITLCIVVTALAVYVMQFAESSFDVDLTDVELSYSSFLYASDDQGQDVLIKQISSDQSRVWTDIEDIPQHVLDAFVSVEDERFFEHDGVDWKRTLGVTVKAVFSSGTEGGSTITQQLVRDITQDKETTIGRKLRAIFRALSLENKYTKYDILESYLNRIGFGGTAYGIGSAAYHYFDKEPSELTIAEAAILAGIVRSPSNYNPYSSLQQSRTRQTYALDHMYQNGYITTQEYEEAYAEKVRFRLPVKGDYYGYVDERATEYYGSYDNDEEDLYYENVSWEEILGESTANAYKWNGNYTVSQNWYVDAALNQIINDLAELFDISYSAANEKFRSGGYTAYLNMNIDMQEKLSAKFEDPYTCLTAYDASLPADSKNLLQAGFVIMDYRGNVLAVAGGIGEKPGDNCFNRASQAVSAIGSTIKPIGNYSLAIDMDKVTYSTMERDASGRSPAL